MVDIGIKPVSAIPPLLVSRPVLLTFALVEGGGGVMVYTWPSKCHTSSLFSLFLTVDLLGKPKTRVENKFEDFFIPHIQYTSTHVSFAQHSFARTNSTHILP